MLEAVYKKERTATEHNLDAMQLHWVLERYMPCRLVGGEDQELEADPQFGEEHMPHWHYQYKVSAFASGEIAALECARWRSLGGHPAAPNSLHPPSPRSARGWEPRHSSSNTRPTTHTPWLVLALVLVPVIVLVAMLAQVLGSRRRGFGVFVFVISPITSGQCRQITSGQCRASPLSSPSPWWPPRRPSG